MAAYNTANIPPALQGGVTPCSTCEPILSNQAAAKYSCYETSRPAYASAAGTLPAIIRDEELFYELQGTSLSSAQIATIDKLYSVRPDVLPACGPIVQSPPIPAQCPAGVLDTQKGTLQRCQRLTGSHVSPSLVSTELPGCLALLEYYDAIPTTKGASVDQTCNGAAIRTIAANAATLLLLKELGGTASTVVADLSRRLAFIDRWYKASKNALGAGDTAGQSALLSEVGQVEGAFWTASHPNGLRSLKLPGASTAGVDADANALVAALTTANGDESTADLAVMNAAFTKQADGTLPITSPPLLLVINDALRSLADHARDAGLFHDFACHYTAAPTGLATSSSGDPCRAINQASQLSAVTAMLGTFPSATDLQTELKADKALLSGTAWLAPFTQLQANHVAFERAVLASIDPTILSGLRPDGSYSPDLVFNTRVASAVPSLSDLGKIAADFSARIASYRSAGLFDPALRNVLPNGIESGAQRQAFVSNLQTQNANLATALTTYKTSLRQTTTDLLNCLQGAQKQYDVSAQLTQANQQYQTLQSQINQMQSAEADEDEAFAKQVASFAKDFGNVKDSGAIDPNALVKVNGAHFFNDFNESEAKFAGFAGDESFHIPDVAVGSFPSQGGKRWKLTVPTGSVLTINSSGKWSPTCALRHFFGPPASPNAAPNITIKSFDGALATSEGFSITGTDSGYSMTSTSHTDTETDNLSIGVSAPCAGLIVTGCGGVSYNHAWAWSDQNTSGTGGQAQSSASFVSGLRTDNTPFPGLPVGSLLLVTMRAGGVGWADVFDVRPVLSGQNAYVINGPDKSPNVDLYLVANELKLNDCPSPGQNKIHVETTLFQPIGAASMLPNLMNAMGQALNYIEKQRDEIVKEGHLLPERESELRSTAVAYLSAPSGDAGAVDISQYPQPFRDLYDAWIDREIARLARAVEIATASNQADLLLLQIQSLQNDQSATGVETRLSQLLAEWSLQDLAVSEPSSGGDEVEFQAALVTKLFNDLYPVLHLRTPDLLAQIQSSTEIQSALKTLSGGSFFSSFIDLANGMNLATEKIIALVASFQEARDPLNPVALQFPRSDRINALYPSCGATVSQPPTTDAGAPSPPTNGGTGCVFCFRTAAQDRSDALWKGICESGLGTFDIRPDDLYTPNAGASDLGCGDGAPVMRGLAAVVTMGGVSDTDPIANFAFEVPIGLGSQMQFPTSQGLESFRISDLTWLPSKVPFLGSPIGHEIVHFAGNKTDPSAGDGLSPFNTYQVNVRALKGAADSPFIRATALTIVFLAESANTGTVAGVTACQRQPALVSFRRSNQQAVIPPRPELLAILKRTHAQNARGSRHSPGTTR